MTTIKGSTNSEGKPTQYQCNDCNAHSFINEIGGCPSCNSLNITKMEDIKFAYPHLPLSKEDQYKIYWDANAKEKMSKLLSIGLKADAQPVKEADEDIKNAALHSAKRAYRTDTRDKSLNDSNEDMQTAYSWGFEVGANWNKDRSKFATEAGGDVEALAEDYAVNKWKDKNDYALELAKEDFIAGYKAAK